MWKKQSFANAANIRTYHSNSNSAMVMHEASEMSCEGAWIMDSACSFHYTSNCKWFSTYSPTDDNVILGNNSSCFVVGIETIQLKTKDGVVCDDVQVDISPSTTSTLTSGGTPTTTMNATSDFQLTLSTSCGM